MPSINYVQQYGRGFSEILLLKQPIPEKIAASVQLWATIHGLEFHTLENSTLYVSGKKPGVFHNKGDGVSHVLVKKPGDNSLWNFQIVSTNSLGLLKEALDGDSVERITNYLNQHRPIENHAEFLSTHARLKAELQRKQDEEERIKAQERQRQKEEDERRHAEAMTMAAVEFLKGDDIGGDTFCDLLQLHGLWFGVHPQTKHFIRERLVSVKNTGGYRYLTHTSLRGGKRSQGSNKVSDIARKLNKLLEEASAADALNGVQKAA